ncbi:hypothetical protein HHI36_004915 [Cryptolaemus montrouzieri]|uniref:Anoctamin n=1 Tax=Cryptolaemus montrouzieri TaxID=559131 RepID=A0ABD2NTJ1_9CUCU
MKPTLLSDQLRNKQLFPSVSKNWTPEANMEADQEPSQWDRGAQEIRLYFGEAIALYFTFLGYYTTSLIVPVAIGLFHMIVPTESVPLFCAFNVVWVTIMLEERGGAVDPSCSWLTYPSLLDFWDFQADEDRNAGPYWIFL